MKKPKKVKGNAPVDDDDDSGLNSKEKLLKEIAKKKTALAIEAAAHWVKIRDHVMLGELKDKKITGFHSVQKLGQQGCVARLTASPLIPKSMGCYSRELESAGGEFKKYSTFYPDLWTETDIKNAVIDAYQHKVGTTGMVTIAKGLGMPIIFKGVDTAYPDYD